jgi:acetyltransferase-like isoleucine patch superfamily enzyme
MSIFSRYWQKKRQRWYRRQVEPVHGLRRDLAYFVAQHGFEIGDYSYAGGPLLIRQWDKGSRLIVGRYCGIAADVEFILGGTHPLDLVTTYPVDILYGAAGRSSSRGDIVIGSDVWIATGATILSGVSIGHGAIVAARAVVTKDVGPYSIVAGNPARPLRQRFDEETVRKLLELRWWELSAEQIRPLLPLLQSTAVGQFIDACSKLRQQLQYGRS